MDTLALSDTSVEACDRDGKSMDLLADLCVNWSATDARLADIDAVMDAPRD